MDSLKSSFPLYNQYPQLSYLDHAATTFMPQCVLSAWQVFHQTNGLSGYRNNSPLSVNAADRLEQSRQQILAHFHAATDFQIVFTRNATDALNTIAYSWGHLLSPGDVILVSAAEHHSNLLCWQRLARETSALLVSIPLLPDGDLDLALLDSMYHMPVKIISLCHTSNATGMQLDIARIIPFKEYHKALLCLDISQAVSHQNLDLCKLGADAYALSAHKMYGPKGIGGLIVKRQLLEQMVPRNLGGGMVWKVMGSEPQWFHDVRRLEAGTQDIASCCAWAEACRFLQSIGLETIGLHNRRLRDQLSCALEPLERLRLIPAGQSPADNILSFVIDGLHSHDLEAALCREEIIIRTGHLCAQPLLHQLNQTSLNRASWGVGVGEDDIEHIASTISRLL